MGTFRRACYTLHESIRERTRYSMKQGKQTSPETQPKPSTGVNPIPSPITTGPTPPADKVEPIMVFYQAGQTPNGAVPVSWADCSEHEHLIPLFLYCLEQGLELYRWECGRLVALVPRTTTPMRTNVTLRVPKNRSITAFEVALRAASTPAGRSVKRELTRLAKWLKREYYQPS